MNQTDLQFGSAGYQAPVGSVALGYANPATGDAPWLPAIGTVPLAFGPSGYQAPIGTVDLTWAPPPPPPWTPAVGTADLAFGPGDYQAPVGTIDLQLGQDQGQPDDGEEPEDPSEQPNQLSINATLGAPIADLRGHLAVRGKIAVNLAGLGAVRISASYDINVDRGPKAGTTSRWERAADAGASLGIRWERPLQQHPITAAPWQDAARLSNATRDRAENPPSLRERQGSPWQEALAIDAVRVATWIYPPRGDRQRSTAWESATRVDHGQQPAWHYPGRLDLFGHPAWETAGKLPALEIRADFGQGRWYPTGGSYPYENAQWPAPGFDPPPVPPEPPTPEPWTPDTDLVMCAPVPTAPWILQFGIDPCSDGGEEPGDSTILIPTRRIYTVTNSAQLVRVADGRDIPASAVTLAIDADSWSWSLTATLAGKNAMALVEGSDAEPIEVDALVNGYAWRILVDGWQLQEAWQRGSGTIRGRSRAAYMGQPYATPRNHTETQDRTAQQLAAQELPYGWTLDWRISDWLVPAGAWSYQGLAPVDAIARIAEAGGGYVQAHRTADTLQILPRYPAAPWEWDSQSALLVPRDVLIQRSSDKAPGDSANAVYVHGQSPGGILANVKRYGTAGDRRAETIVDPLITDPAPARARGIAALAATGRQATETHELPLASDLGGLVTPGRMIEVGQEQGGSFQGQWRGLVRGLSLSANASRANNGGTQLTVRQRITVERHYEEA